MTEKEQIDDILYDFFSRILEDCGNENITLIFENENGVRPVPPFLSIAYNSMQALGTNPHFSSKEENNVFQRVSSQPIERNCTLRGFGKSTEEILNNIRDFLQYEEYIDLLASKKITIKSMDEVFEASSVLSDDKETFYTLDFVVTYNRVVTLEGEYISGVGISNNGLDRPDMESKTKPIDIVVE